MTIYIVHCPVTPVIRLQRLYEINEFEGDSPAVLRIFSHFDKYIVFARKRSMPFASGWDFKKNSYLHRDNSDVIRGGKHINFLNKESWGNG